MMNLIEPQRGQSLIHTLNTITFNSPVLVKLVPILADVFVFAYPLLLVVRYIIGIIKNDRQHKSDSLTVFASAIYVAVVNITLQSFLHKDRPIFAGDNSIHLILKELPTASFPSDHAAVSMIMGLTVTMIGFQRKNIRIKSVGLILMVCSIVMSVSRVAVGVHWPTDIIAGWGVAIIIASLMSITTIQLLQQQYINTPIVKLQERLFDITGMSKILPK